MPHPTTGTAHWDEVPEKYNIALDVSTRHSPEALSMIWRDDAGATRRVTWRWMRARAARFGTFFRDRGVRPGDRVALVLPASPDTAAAVLGALRIGAVVVMAGTLWGEEALAFRLDDSAPALTLTTPERLAAFEASGTGHLIALTPRLLDGVPEECEPEVTRADDPAVIYYTSGTSGPPKGVVHAHRWLPGHNEFTVCHQLRPGELFHGAGDWAWSLAKLLGPWRHGAVPFVFHQPGRFDPVALFEAMAAEGVGNMLFNPTMLRRLRAVLPEAGKQIPLRPRRAYSSSEPLPADLARWFTEQFHVPLYDYYGLTESYPMIGVLPGTTAPSGSMGRALPGWQVAVLDDRDRPVPPGTPGQICLRARTNPQYPLGYWNRPADTRAVFEGEWFRTGDTATQDDRGNFYFLGRSDDVIISSGYRIGPYDLEAVLDTHPAVAESAVVGDPDPDRGQIVHAFIVLADGHRPSPRLTASIQEHVRTVHSRFAYPRRVDYVDALPRSTTHKIQRAALRAGR
ncbi:AMP-binding protein [Actinomadura madurae]|uniref:acyl-CoA synthetase n=1 Tax=Actinomadura madurae TaxID=1993 RepID=UPI00399AAD48